MACLSRSTVIESAVLEKMRNLPHHHRIFYDKRVGAGIYDEVTHFRKLGILDRDHAVISPVHECGQ